MGNKRTTDSFVIQWLLFFCGCACIIIGLLTFYQGGWQEFLETPRLTKASSRFPQSGLVFLLLGIILSFFSMRNIIRLLQKRK